MPTQDLAELADRVFKTLAEALGPTIGCELAVGAIELQETGGLPDDDFAVQPVALQLQGTCVGELAIVGEVVQLAPLARRLREDDDPDKEREIEPDELEAIGEVLQQMAAALPSALHGPLSSELAAEPARWWRTSVPGDACLPEGDFRLACVEFAISGAGTVELGLRLPVDLFHAAAAKRHSASVHDLPEDVRGAISAVLEAEGIDIAEPGGDDAEDAPAPPDLVFLDATSEESFERCRALRMDDATWQTHVVFCSPEPTRDLVIRALESGASHVLAVPPEERDITRLLADL